MAETGNVETRFHGLPISGGIAMAASCLFRQGFEQPPEYHVSGAEITHELRRVRTATAAVHDQFEMLRQTATERLGPAEGEILATQVLILQDPALLDGITELIDSGHNAEAAVAHILDAYEDRLHKVPNAYLNERAADLSEIKRRLLGVLGNMSPIMECPEDPHCQTGKHRIVVTDELTPTMAIELDAEEILGIVTARGGVTSHAAILARALGIPAVSGIEHIHDLVACGTELLVNGDTGEVVLWPSKETCRICVAPARPHARITVPEPVEGLRIMANIGRAAEVKDVRAMKAEGIGLYRTELELFAAGHLLTEDEQFMRYAAVVKAMGSKPVYFRVLDVGGDKPLPLVEVLKEANPALGLRGGRFLLSHPELLRTQARALARVSCIRPIHVMYPMVIDLAQFRRLRQVFEEAVADLPCGRIYHGVMFEVPSAIIEARELLEAADFGSIGTNDLVQFVFAVDRNNERVAEDYFFDRPILWRLIEDLVRTAADVGRPLSLCGELAAEPLFTERLMSMGITTVSVNARHIPAVRRAARQASHKKLHTHV